MTEPTAATQIDSRLIHAPFQKHQQPAAVGVFLRLSKIVVPLHHKTQKSRL